jgi:pimeloyl-ACP methyl ester carboxylesterase
MNSEIDVRDILAGVNVPTLVLHSAGDRMCSIGGAGYMAERVRAARFVELPGADHYIWFGGDADRFADEIERFLTGTLVALDNGRTPPRRHARRVWKLGGLGV